MKYYVIAGEASGDLHASHLIREIRKLDPDSEFRCWGGDRMEEAGGQIIKHYRDLAFMGFLEVLLNIRTIMANLKFCKSDIDRWKPDAIILVDYPGFNMRIAEYAHQKGYRVIYYIAPQAWAWKHKRVHKINRWTDLAFVVLPFEKEFHARYGYSVEFAGHPLLDSISGFKPDPDFHQSNSLSEKPIIAVVPGSRKQEITRILPIMLGIISEFPGYQFIIAGVKTLPKDTYDRIIRGRDVKVITGSTYDLISHAKAAIVTSGTATLETGLLGVPQVVCYRMSFLTALLAWMFIRVENISLVNLVLGRKSVAELIQYRFNTRSLSKELRLILENEDNYKRIKSDYLEMINRLGESGASAKVAQLIIKKMFDTKPSKK